MGRLRLALALAVVALVVPLAIATGAGERLTDLGDRKAAEHLGERVAGRAGAPLTGEGQNMALVANVPIAEASDIEMHGDHAFVGSYAEGMVIVDIADPTRPRRVGVFDCGGGSQYDVQLSPDASYAVLSTDSTGSTCHPDAEGSIVIDIRDRANPREIAFIPIAVGTHTQTLDGHVLYVNNYQEDYHRLEIFNLTNPAAPTKLSEWDFGDGASSVHDSYPDHRPDGKVLLYAASIEATDVLDVTDPAQPRLLQRITDPEVSVAHQAEPNFARNVLIVTDEFGGGGTVPGCGRLPTAPATTALPYVGAVQDIGAMHFYPLAKDGTIAGNGTLKAGTFNLPLALTAGVAGCTVHVFWQAPDENRLVTAWYQRGTRVVDFSDPGNARELGWFEATGADTWAAKPHRGYIFTGDLARGMDVLRYTGSGWPKTAGPQEVQRALIQRNFRPPAPAPRVRTRRGTTGSAQFRRAVRVPRSERRTTLVTATFRDARGRVVSKSRVRLRSGRRHVLRANVTATPGTYTYVIRVGERGKVLARGKVRVRRARRGRTSGGAPRFVCRIVV